MNLLLDDAPDHITVCGQVIPIQTDFRTWIRFENTMLEDCDNEERFKAILDVTNGMYSDIPEFMDQVLWLSLIHI